MVVVPAGRAQRRAEDASDRDARALRNCNADVENAFSVGVGEGVEEHAIAQLKPEKSSPKKRTPKEWNSFKTTMHPSTSGHRSSAR